MRNIIFAQNILMNFLHIGPNVIMIYATFLKKYKVKDHDVIKYDSATPKIKLIKKDLEEIRRKIAKAKKILIR